MAERECASADDLNFRCGLRGWKQRRADGESEAQGLKPRTGLGRAEARPRVLALGQALGPPDCGPGKHPLPWPGAEATVSHLLWFGMGAQALVPVLVFFRL